MSNGPDLETCLIKGLQRPTLLATREPADGRASCESRLVIYYSGCSVLFGARQPRMPSPSKFHNVPHAPAQIQAFSRAGSDGSWDGGGGADTSQDVWRPRSSHAHERIPQPPGILVLQALAVPPAGKTRAELTAMQCSKTWWG